MTTSHTRRKLRGIADTLSEGVREYEAEIDDLKRQMKALRRGLRNCMTNDAGELELARLRDPGIAATFLKLINGDTIQ